MLRLREQNEEIGLEIHGCGDGDNDDAMMMQRVGGEWKELGPTPETRAADVQQQRRDSMDFIHWNGSHAILRLPSAL